MIVHCNLGSGRQTEKSLLQLETKSLIFWTFDLSEFCFYRLKQDIFSKAVDEKKNNKTLFMLYNRLNFPPFQTSTAVSYQNQNKSKKKNQS